MIAGNGVLVHGLGGTYPDQLDAAGPEDWSASRRIPMDVRRWKRRDCRQAGVPVLALTDSPLAPIQAHATQALLFDAGTPSYFHSMVGSLALVERLLAAGRRWRRGRATAHRRFERRLDASSAYFGGSPTRAEAPGKHDRIARRRRAEAGASSPRFEAYRVPTADSHLALAPSLSVAASIFAWRWRPPAWPDPPRRAQDAAKRPPIRLVVPFAAGGTTDVLARLLAEELRAVLGQPVLVENKGGRAATSAPPKWRVAGDGATLMMATPGPLAVNQYLYPKPGYNAEKDFAAINNVAFAANVLMASAQSGIRAFA